MKKLFSILGIIYSIGTFAAESGVANVWVGNDPAGACVPDRVMFTSDGKAWCCRTGSWERCSFLSGSSTITGSGLYSTALAVPTNCEFTATLGTLSAGTYAYRVSAQNAVGRTPPSTETTITLTQTGGVIVRWNAVPGATSYRIYGRTSGGELQMADVSAPATTWVDYGTITPSGAMPSTNGTAGITIPSTSVICFDTYCLSISSSRITTSTALNVTGYVYATGLSATSGNSAIVYGAVANGASAIANKSVNISSLTTDGAEIHTFYSDSGTTKRATITKDGAIRLGIGAGAEPTCDAAHRGMIYYTPGAASVADKWQKCHKDASDVYAWVAF